MNELLENICALNKALFLKKERVLVISDLQLGQEEQLRRSGSFVVNSEYKRMQTELQLIIKQVKNQGDEVQKIVINGDLKHEFSRINNQEWEHIIDLFDFFQKQNIEVILVKGNHDNMLFPIAQKRGYVMHDYYIVNDVLFCHGHEEPAQDIMHNIKTVVIGHEHPAIRFEDGIRKETTKCFLVGKWKRKNLIVLPSFSNMTQGTDMLTSKGLGSFLQKKEDMYVFALIEKEIIACGKVKDIKKALAT